MSAVATHNPYQGMTPFAEPDAERFFGRKRWCHRLLDRLRDERRVLFLVGPSGCGKTSLINLITGYDSATGGSLRIGESVFGEDDWREVRRRVGLVMELEIWRR